jgi:methylenetetrahydrofolate reductase (NADPH)
MPNPALANWSAPRSANRFADKLRAGDFVVTGEIVPPVSGGPETLLARAAPFKDRLDAINLTDGPGAQVHMSSVAAAGILAHNGFEPIMQMTCRDRNRIALQSDLLGASALGVRNALFLTGDDPSAGDQPDAKPVFDAKSNDLITWSREMANEGVLPSGRAITSPPHFFVGAADVPMKPPPDWVPHALVAKADAGAHFIQTQLCYDLDVARAYISALTDHGLTERLFILLGTGPLTSARSARWMNDNLFGVTIPEPIIDRLERAADPKREGLSLCHALIEQLRELPGLSGVHLMAPGNIGALPGLLDLVVVD